MPRSPVVLVIATFRLLTAQTFPTHSVDVQLDFSPRTSLSTWKSGYLPKFSRPIGGGKPTVWMLDKNGATTIAETEIWFPDASHVEVEDVTADSLGNLYASVEAWSGDGRGTGAICRVSQGKPILVIRTDDFLTEALAVSKSGEIWAFGLPIVLQATRRVSLNYETLWRFDSSGRVIGKLLPRAEFGEDVIPTHVFGDVGGPHLWATGTRIGLFSATASRWIEYDAKTGAKVVDVPVAPPVAADGVKAAIGNLVMTDSANRVFAFVAYRHSDASHVSQLCELDKTSGRWVPVPRASQEFNGLCGADGDSLVLRAGTKTFGWFSTGAPAK